MLTIIAYCENCAQIWWARDSWGTDGFFQIWCNFFEN